jgi:FlaA1/EpsC-like NDP-sugar epimerase
MGEPVRILDLARDLIRLSGYRPDLDIPIKITGARPGEKIFEELLYDEENSQHTTHEKIFVSTQNGIDPALVQPGVDHLARLSRDTDCAPETLRAEILRFAHNGFTAMIPPPTLIGLPGKRAGESVNEPAARGLSAP